MLDDLLGTRIRHSPIPSDAIALLRRHINSDEFDLCDILYNGVPMYPKENDDVSSLASWYKQRKDDVIRAKLSYTRLIEGPCKKWWVELSWDVPVPESRTLNMEALRDEIYGQLCDGWGEGLEQFRFGPCVPLQNTRRFSFNLTIDRIYLI